MSDELEVKQTISQIENLLNEMDELSQPRTNFALEHFVVGQHDMPGRQRTQVLAELQAMMFSLADTNDDITKAEIKLQRLSAWWYPKTVTTRMETSKLQRNIRSMQIQRNGRMRECEFLLGLLDKMPLYTREELEKEEAEYWQRRLLRQHFLQTRGDFGNLDAILQMATSAGVSKPALPVGVDQVFTFMGMPEALAALPEINTTAAPLFKGDNHAALPEGAIHGE
jgi:hypothetical protein